jgi:hypothetical protein
MDPQSSGRETGFVLNAGLLRYVFRFDREARKDLNR